MAVQYNKSEEQLREMIKNRYDGYHFASVSPDIYNPFSVLTAMADKIIDNYWFSSGNSGSLARIIASYGTDLQSVDGMQLAESSFYCPTEAMENAIPLLYQAGYITIKEYDFDTDSYILGIPNDEVRMGCKISKNM